MYNQKKEKRGVLTATMLEQVGVIVADCSAAALSPGRTRPESC